METAYAADWERLRNRLRDVYRRLEVREALFVASPDLEDRLEVWVKEPDTEAGLKIERALVRYFLRTVVAGRLVAHPGDCSGLGPLFHRDSLGPDHAP